MAVEDMAMDVRAMKARAKVAQTRKQEELEPGADFGESPGKMPGVEVWRIEAFKVVPVPRAAQGKFYSGDSYIVLHTRARGGGGRALDWDLYFWLGEATSQDEAAVAAYKTVELDDRLGGRPTQYRETQGHESKGFLAVFPRIQYLKGGVDSALKSAAAREGTFEPRLLHCKGAKTVLVSEVARRAASLNRGDVFVLDANDTIYQWNGASANRREKAKALEVALAIRDDDRQGKAELVVIDDPGAGHAQVPLAELDEDERRFWAALDGTRADVREAAAAGEDAAAGGSAGGTAAAAGGGGGGMLGGLFGLGKGKGKGGEGGAAAQPANAAGAGPAGPAPPKLFVISDARGSLKQTAVGPAGGGALTRSLLDDDDAFLLDAGAHVFVWIGKRASQGERQASMRVAAKYLRAAGRPAHTPTTRVASGGEPAAFRAHFVDWLSAEGGGAPVTDLQAFRKGQARVSAAQTERSTEELAAELAASPARADVGGASQPLAERPPAGAVRVWRIEKLERAELRPEELGLLNANDCYIVLHTDERAKTRTLYYWLGAKSTQDERGAVALQTVALSDELGGSVPQVRVCQGHEPPRLLSLFAPRLVVFSAGGVETAFRSVPPRGAPADPAPVAAAAINPASEGPGTLFQVRGTTARDVHSTQVAARAASLSSYDCFLVCSALAASGAGGSGALPAWMQRTVGAAKGGAPTLWVWRGVHSNQAEREGADEAAQLLLHASAHGVNPNVAGPPGSKLGAEVKVVVVDEGSEPAAMWAAIGGKGEYARVAPDGKGGGGAGMRLPFGSRGMASNSAYAQVPNVDDARLFHCSDRTGVFKVEEVRNFAQDDLDPDDVMLLDVVATIYVWVGSGASENERRRAPELADQYAHTAGTGGGRPPHVPVIRVEQGAEPLHFKACFFGWSDEKGAVGYDPFEAKLKASKQVRRAKSIVTTNAK